MTKIEQVEMIRATQEMLKHVKPEEKIACAVVIASQMQKEVIETAMNTIIKQNKKYMESRDRKEIDFLQKQFIKLQDQCENKQILP